MRLRTLREQGEHDSFRTRCDWLARIWYCFRSCICVFHRLFAQNKYLYTAQFIGVLVSQRITEAQSVKTKVKIDAVHLVLRKLLVLQSYRMEYPSSS